METLSTKEGRKIIISSQLLGGTKAKSKNNLLNIIESLSYIQIDTISVVERAHNHILWSRMPVYKQEYLDKLVEKDKTIFEYWSHAAAYLPMRDYRFSLLRKDIYTKKYKVYGNANKKIIRYVYDRIKNEGPLQSKDFEDVQTGSTGWWDWKPSKDALDFLFHQGKLMIAARKSFQKVYDLTERVLPEIVDTRFPSEIEFYEHLILNSISSLGLVSEKEITYQRRYDRKKFISVLNELIEEGNIIETKIKDINNKYYTTDVKLGYLNKNKSKPELHILSPFDNLVIQRNKLKDFFRFDYTIECYVPESKRKFGYFCLPVLYGDKFIARIDAKADRANNNFIIKNVFWEGKPTGINSLNAKIKKLALFSGCENITGIL